MSRDDMKREMLRPDKVVLLAKMCQTRGIDFADIDFTIGMMIDRAEGITWLWTKKGYKITVRFIDEEVVITQDKQPDHERPFVKLQGPLDPISQARYDEDLKKFIH